MYKKGRIKLVYSFDYIYICGNVSLYKPKGQRKRSILCEFCSCRHNDNRKRLSSDGCIIVNVKKPFTLMTLNCDVKKFTGI